MEGLIYIPKVKHQNLKLLMLIGVLSFYFYGCSNDKKIENYRTTGEAQYLNLIKQMEANYTSTELDTLIKKDF